MRSDINIKSVMSFRWIIDRKSIDNIIYKKMIDKLIVVENIIRK
jgi:hypothetical protein